MVLSKLKTSLDFFLNYFFAFFELFGQNVEKSKREPRFHR